MTDQATRRIPEEESGPRWRQERDERNRELANAMFRELREVRERNRELTELIVTVISTLAEANMWTTASVVFGPKLVRDLNEVMRAAGWVWEAPKDE